jgi:hypothetical protein
MKTIKMFGDFDPLNTKPATSNPSHPQISAKPSLNDAETEIKWHSPSYLGEWILSGPDRKKAEALAIAKEMKYAETGSEPFVDRLPPLEIFMSTFAQKLNPHSWTIDFNPEDLDWTTPQPTTIHQGEE